MSELVEDIYEEILSLLGPHSQMLFRLTNKANFAAPKTELLTEYLSFLKRDKEMYVTESLANMIHGGYKKLSRWKYNSQKNSLSDSKCYYAKALLYGDRDLAKLIAETEGIAVSSKTIPTEKITDIYLSIFAKLLKKE